MARKTYVMRGGKLVEANPGQSITLTPFIQSDELPGLRHPVTGKRYTSRSAYIKDTRAMGLEIVGNDLMSKQPDRRVANKPIPEEQITDAIEYAESLHSDPSKQRAWRENQRATLETYQELLKNGK